MTRRPDPDEYTLRLIDMPARQGGMISEDPDGHLNVYVNARHSHDQQLLDAKHEFDHWANGDLDSDRDIREVEGGDGGTSNHLPPLMRARDLMPPPPRPRPAPPDPEPVISPAPPKRPTPQPRTWLSDYEWAHDILFKLPYREDYQY